MQGTQVSMDVLSLTANISFRDQDGKHERLSKEPLLVNTVSSESNEHSLHPSQREEGNQEQQGSILYTLSQKNAQ